MKSVSVIIPTYKNRGGLKKSIDSVIAQDYEGLKEIIVVDDNDSQSEYRVSTELLMKQYEDNSKVIYWRHDINRNGAAARNTGIKVSTGDYIAFLDDDDMFLANKITKQVDYLNNHPNVSVVYCHAKRGTSDCPKYQLYGNCSRDILMLQSNFFTPSLMFRRESLLDINGFDESFRRHQDYELLLRFFAAGYEIACLPEVLIEIGKNEGENTPSGTKLEEIKRYFFKKFDKAIAIEEAKTPGFRNQVYAKHYTGVFLSHIKNCHPILACKALKYSFKAPSEFWTVIKNSIIVHLNGTA